jgi:transposase
VYIDESGMQENLTRSHSWVKRGTVYVEKVSAKHRHERINVIDALRGKQMVALDSFIGTRNSRLFNHWLERRLCPKLSSGDTLIMDNAPSHVKGEIRKIIARYKCAVLFLPPYLPELNPIEHCWANFKAWLKGFNGSAILTCAQIGHYFDINIQRA